MSRDTRPSAVAGQWYPGTRDALLREVDAHLAFAGHADTSGCPRAIIAPHAGLVYSGPVAAWAYAQVRACRYAAVVLVGPSHFVGFAGISIWPRGQWETPLGTLPVAEQLASAIAGESDQIIEHAPAHGREHSLEMQLPFVARLLPGVPIVPLVMGFQTRETAMALGDALGRAVAARSDGGEVLLVASSDLSHYEDAVTAARLDSVVLGHVEGLDADGLMQALEHEPRHACGGGPMVSVLRAAARLGATRAQVLRYADSGDVSGDKSSVVGYMAAAISVIGADDQRRLLSLARRAIEARVRREPPPAPDRGGALESPHGAFVTIHCHGDLRGCLGRLDPDEPLGETVAQLAASVSDSDPRFAPLRQDELDALEVEISVLTPEREVRAIADVEIGRHGVIVEQGARRGLLLPQVATEYGWDAETFVSQTCVKAGLPADAWRRGARILVFEAQVFGER